MATYKRYYRLQKYVGNAPADPAEYKQGEIYELSDFNSLEDCVGVVPEEAQFKWVLTNNYVCDGTTSYYTEQKYYSVDGGNTWIAVLPAEYQKSTTIRSQNDEDCGYVPDTTTTYRWVVVDGYVCDGTSKYTKEKRQYSTDGINWFDVSPEEIQKGTLLQTNSTDCGYMEPITQWVGTDQTVCQGYDKYVIQKEQISYDGGVTWTDTGDTQIGNLIESNSYDCDYGVSWVEVENEYICEDAVYWVYPKGETELYDTNIGFTFTLDHSDDSYDYYLIEGNGSHISFAYTTLISGGYVDLSNVGVSLGGVFNNCNSLSILDLTSWDVSPITSIGSLFAESSNVTSINLSGWNVSNITMLYSLFEYCVGLQEIYLDGWDLSNCEEYADLFNNCNALRTIYMRGCNAATQSIIEECLTAAGLINNVNIIRN